MRRTCRLTLHRETVRTLDSGPSLAVVGGVITDLCTLLCRTEYCLPTNNCWANRTVNC